MITKQFEFKNDAALIVPVLKQVHEFIKRNLPEHSLESKILFKAKIVVTELLTNSLKHSGGQNTNIEVCVGKKEVIICKTDNGSPLPLFFGQPLAEAKTPITNDVLHTLYAVTKENNKVHFFCEENNIDDVEAIENIVEHFGLLIITKSSEEFTYHFDQSSGANTFHISLKF